MSKDAQRPGTAGFALTEALVAALLLALALLGSGAALVQSLQGQHAALLQTRAADLAADLAEAIRARPSAAERDREIAGWRAAAQHTLPWATAIAREVGAAGAGDTNRLDIELHWRDSRTGTAAFHLPVAAIGP